MQSISSGTRMGAISLAGLLVSCLVTNQVDYDQPIITSELARDEPAQEFLTVPVEPDEECVRTGAGEVPFSVTISDLNLEEQLELRIMLNNVYVDKVAVSPTGEEARESVRFCLGASRLNQPCNLVEALVSSNFDRSTQREPYHTRFEDLASAHWWVIGNAEDNPFASYRDCPEPLPDAGVP